MMNRSVIHTFLTTSNLRRSHALYTWKKKCNAMQSLLHSHSHSYASGDTHHIGIISSTSLFTKPYPYPWCHDAMMNLHGHTLHHQQNLTKWFKFFLIRIAYDGAIVKCTQCTSYTYRDMAWHGIREAWNITQHKNDLHIYIARTIARSLNSLFTVFRPGFVDIAREISHLHLLNVS